MFVLSLVFLPAARAGEMVCSDLNCRFTVPADMETMSRVDLADMNRLASIGRPRGGGTTPARVVYSAGLRQRGSTTVYVMLQGRELASPDHQTQLDIIKKAIPAGDIRWDDTLKAFIIDQNFNNGREHLRSYGFPGKTEIVYVHCHTTKGTEEDQYRPIFDGIAASFTFSPGHGAETPSRWTIWLWIGGAVVVLAGGTGAFLMFRKKHKKSSAPATVPARTSSPVRPSATSPAGPSAGAIPHFSAPSPLDSIGQRLHPNPPPPTKH